MPAIALAILLEYRLGDPFAALDTVLLREFGMNSLAAPVIEELTKGLALLLLFFLARDQFDNVLALLADYRAEEARLSDAIDD